MDNLRRDHQQGGGIVLRAHLGLSNLYRRLLHLRDGEFYHFFDFFGVHGSLLPPMQSILLFVDCPSPWVLIFSMSNEALITLTGS